MESLFPGEWTPGSHNRAPFTVSVCGRTITIVDADPTDESPNRPQEGFILTTTAPGDINVSVVVYEQFPADAMEAVQAALPLCGPTTLTNPVDGWTLTTESNGTLAAISDLAGFLISSESTRAYTDSRATRYGETRLFFGESSGFLVRVNVNATSTDPTDLYPAADLLALVVAITRDATGG